MLKDYYDKNLSKKALSAIDDELSTISISHRFGTYSAARKFKTVSSQRILLYRGIYYVSDSYLIDKKGYMISNGESDTLYLITCSLVDKKKQLIIQANLT